MMFENIHSFFSFARLCKGTEIDSVCLELMTAVNIVDNDELNSISDIVAKREANKLECCLLMVNECLTMNLKPFLCYGTVDESLTSSLDHYLRVETIFEKKFFNRFSGTYKPGYFVIVNNVGYIPYLYLKFDSFECIELVQYCANNLGVYTIEKTLLEWQSLGYPLEVKTSQFKRKSFMSAALFQFDSKYPSCSLKLEFRDSILELYEKRNDCLARCLIKFGSSTDNQSLVHEYFCDRSDFLEERSINPISNQVIERFEYGRKDGLKTLCLNDIPTLYEFYDTRSDCLIKRVISNAVITDSFSYRNDFLETREYNDNTYINNYNCGEIDRLEFNVMNDTVKMVYNVSNDSCLKPYVLLEKNSYSVESKDPYTIVETVSNDFKSTTNLRTEVRNRFSDITYEIKKILNERTEIQTKLDNILKDRTVQEKFLNSDEADFIKTKKERAKTLVQVFNESKYPKEMMEEYFERQYLLRLKILNQKLAETTSPIEKEVIQNRIIKIDEEKKLKVEVFRKQMSEVV
eukprot:NODE_44_length_28780_cov_0.148496.p4 type:complete len:519 gc:universal NODE_44_length_28780_cov_0.148496:8924-7368(-)